MGIFLKLKTQAKRLPAFTLAELLVVLGIITALTGISIPAIQRARISSIDANRISAVNKVAIYLNIYYSKFREYPNSLQDIVDKNIMPVRDKYIPGTSYELFYQKDYVFCAPSPNCVSQIRSWMSRASDASSLLDLSSAPSEFSKQYYALDQGSSSDCAYLQNRKVYYRLGVPLIKSRREAESDVTPCSDRFFDVIGQ